ncbi:MAG: serine/threonine protein kinase [Acidobacteria bacterium]|nr:serine/threonine protein kinase [Acidobacteriota bacterium]
MEMIGRSIGNYKITGELARGGMGTVYHAQHQNLPREVVVKSILLTAFSPSVQSHLKARFRREAYIQSQLDHPNIVRVYEFFTLEDNYFLIMEYVQGMSLRDLIARQGVPTHTHAIYVAKQALAALDYAHNFSYVDENAGRSTGIIHRDIKPANLLIGARGALKITDFGIVKVMGDDELTQSGFQPGTVEYMSPEQILGHEVDERSDIYSLGVTLYEMLTGRLPFPRSATGSDWLVRKGHIEGTPPALTTLRPEIHPELSAIVMKSLEKDPAARFRSSSEFLQALDSFERQVTGRVQGYRNRSGRLAGESSNTRDLASGFTVPIERHKQEFSDPDHLAEESITIPLDTLIDKPVEWSPAGEKGTQYNTTVDLPVSVPETVPMPSESVDSVHDLSKRKVYISVPSAPPVRRRWPVAATILGFLALAGAAVYYLLSGQTASKIEQTSVSTRVSSAVTATAPSPEATQTVEMGKPLRTVVVDTVPLSQAREAEAREDYSEAISRYEVFLRLNPTAPETRSVADRLVTLRQFQGLMTSAQTAIESRKYLIARQQLTEALKLIPESELARNGLVEVDRKISAATQGIQRNRRNRQLIEDRPDIRPGQRIPPRIRRNFQRPPAS